MTEAKVFIDYSNERTNKGPATRINGIEGAAFYQYERIVPKTEEEEEVEPTFTNGQTFDKSVSRFIKIGLCTECFGAGPAGYQCMECEAADLDMWFAALRTEDEIDICPIFITENVGTGMVHPTSDELEGGFYPLDGSDDDPYFNKTIKTWTGELNAKFEAMKRREEVKSATQRMTRPGGSTRPTKSAKASSKKRGSSASSSVAKMPDHKKAKGARKQG